MRKNVFVLDLDFTLWDAGGTWCDCTTPPYHNVNQHIVDSSGSEIKLYPNIRDILNTLKQHGKIIAIASRTSAPLIALELLERFGIRDYFDIEEIYPSGKVSHLLNIIQKTGSHRNEIVFFDDEMRNIHDVKNMNIESVFIPDGLTLKQIKPYL